MTAFSIKSVWQRPSHFIAFGFGSGCLPIAPGTWGSIAALPFYAIFQGFSPALYAFMLVATFLLGCWVCDVAGRDVGVVDHPGIVFDEMVGMWIVLWGCPNHIGWQLTALVLFRLFDITKPFPIRRLERAFDNGFGVMIDDVLAALYAWTVLQVLLFF